MCQFRDNILIGSTAPSEAHCAIVAFVIRVLQRAWGLHACDCGKTCSNQCLSHVVHAMGLCMIRDTGGMGAAHSHPSSLKPDWSLRLGPSRASPSLAPKHNPKAVFISVLTNTIPWCNTWASQILSALAWLQVALLSGYSRVAAMRALHAAIARAFAVTVHCTKATIKAVYSISY